MSRFPEVSVPEFTRSLRAKWVRGITQRDGRRVGGVRTTRPRSSASPIPAQTHGGEHQTLLTADGVRLSAVHVPGRDREWAFVVCHGFTGTWRGPHMTRVVTALRPFGGVVAFDFRGHGGSRGRSTVGDLEVFDLHAAVEWARVLGYRNVATVGFSMGASVVVRHGGLCASGAHSSTTDAVVSVSGPGPVAGIWSMATPPDLQGQGAGRAALLSAMSRARGRGAVARELVMRPAAAVAAGWRAARGGPGGR